MIFKTRKNIDKSESVVEFFLSADTAGVIVLKALHEGLTYNILDINKRGVRLYRSCSSDLGFPVSTGDGRIVVENSQ